VLILEGQEHRHPEKLSDLEGHLAARTRLVIGHKQIRTPVANATLSTASSSINAISATTSLFETMNLSNNPISKVRRYFSEGGGVGKNK